MIFIFFALAFCAILTNCWFSSEILSFTNDDSEELSATISTDQTTEVI